jgi:hypothetical protein
MAAGLGFKTFTTGEVLTAADVNGYLMQGINVFADATERDAEVTSPQEGQFAYTKDNNSLWYYSGSAWVASGATGDIEGVTAGVGISGGGTSGTVTVTNSMATAIDAKGDLIAGTGSDTFDRLAVGANDTVLMADSTAATGLKWGSAGVSSASQNVDTAQTTTSGTFTDLSTVQSVTLTTGTKALVMLSSQIENNAVQNTYVSVEVSGASTIAADAAYGVFFRVPQANFPLRAGAHRVFTTLTAGSNTFTMKFRSNGGNTAVFSNRTLTVIDLGS